MSDADALPSTSMVTLAPLFSKQVPLPDPSLNRSNPLVSLKAAPILLLMMWLPVLSALPVVLVGSEKDATPHRKLPKIELFLTVQLVVPKRITPAPIGELAALVPTPPDTV